MFTYSNGPLFESVSSVKQSFLLAKSSQSNALACGGETLILDLVQPSVLLSSLSCTDVLLLGHVGLRVVTNMRIKIIDEIY